MVSVAALRTEPGNELGLCSESLSPGLPWVGLRWGLGVVSSLPQPRVPAGLFCFPPSPCLCLVPDPLACRPAVCLSLGYFLLQLKCLKRLSGARPL